MNKEKFDITGMTCSACSTRVEQCVRKLPGVSEVSVNLLKNSMVVSYDEHSLDTAGIVAAVEKRDTEPFRKRLLRIGAMRPGIRRLRLQIRRRQNIRR